MPDSNGLILTSINKSRIKGLAVFKNTLDQDTLNNYLDQDGCINFNQLKSDLFSKSIQERPKLEVSKEPLVGQELLLKTKELSNLSQSEIAKSCGYVLKQEDGTEQVKLSQFLKALVAAKLSTNSTIINEDDNSEDQKEEHDSSTNNLDIKNNLKKSKIKSLYDLFYSKTYSETGWLYTAPILEDLYIESNNINIQGNELLEKLNEENIDFAVMEKSGINIDEKLIHLFVEIPIQSLEEKIIIYDNFDESKILKINNIENLNISLGETPSQKNFILGTVWTDGEESFYGDVEGGSLPFHDRKEWELDKSKDERIYLKLTNQSGIFEYVDIEDAINSKLKLTPNYEKSKYISPEEMSNEPMSFYIELEYTEGNYTEFEDIDEIDEDDLGEYMHDAGDSFTIHLPEITIGINDEEHTLTAKEIDNLYGDVIQPKEGKIVVYTDRRDCRFSDFPSDYGEEDSPDNGWECELLKKDILRNKVEVDKFKYNSEDKYKMYWEYKGEEIRSWIMSDISCEENVSVLVEGKEVMSY